MADGLLALPPPSQGMVCAHWKGAAGRRADGYPPASSGCPDGCPSISMACSGYGGTSTYNWRFQALRAQVFTVLPPKGARVKFSILANSNEDGKRVGPGKEGSAS